MNVLRVGNHFPSSGLVEISLEIRELLLNEATSVLNRLIVDGRPELANEEIEKEVRLKFTDFALQLRSAKGLKLFNDPLPALVGELYSHGAWKFGQFRLRLKGWGDQRVAHCNRA